MLRPRRHLHIILYRPKIIICVRNEFLELYFKKTSYNHNYYHKIRNHDYIIKHIAFNQITTLMTTSHAIKSQMNYEIN